jgi:1-acyl-sn-glycerol-3-phosphate acyltransferase
LKAYGQTDVPLSILIFPEGTRWTKKKHADAVEYAKECNSVAKRKLHVPVHTMIPRYKGFQALVRGLDGIATHVYDITLAYNGFALSKGSKGPGYFGLYTHDVSNGAEQCEFHMHVRRLKLSDLPKDDLKLKETLFTWFAEKDQILADFYNQDSRVRKFKNSKQLKPLPSEQWIPAISLMTVLASLFLHFILFGRHWW